MRMARSLGWLEAAVGLLAGALNATSAAHAQTVPAPAPTPSASAAPTSSAAPSGAPAPPAEPAPPAAPAPAPSPAPPSAPPQGGFRPLPWPYPYPPPYAFYPPPGGDDREASERPKRRGEWYGWQTIIIHAASASLLAVAPLGDGAAAPLTVPVAMGGMILGGPIVHWGHGRTARGFAVLGLHFGAAGLVGLTGGAIGCSFGACQGYLGPAGFLIGLAFGAPIGSIAAFIIDVSLLSFEEVPDPNKRVESKGRWPALSLVPSVDIRPGHGVIGLAGTF